MTDSHCHLNFGDFDGRRDEVIADARKNSVHTIINVGVDIDSSEKSIVLAERYEGLFATAGIHPHDARTYNDEVDERLRTLAEHDRVVAIGEAGLDFYRDLSPRELQKKVFVRQLEIAAEKKLPVVIHTRESLSDTCDIIRDFTPDLSGGVFHCFPGTVDEALEVLELGFYISVGGVITFPGARMAEVAKEVPLERILLETDSPYLAPVPHRGKKNEPAYVKFVAEKMAGLRDQPISEIEKITDRNARKLFRLTDIFGG
jgi:TatD DNase family protein